MAYSANGLTLQFDGGSGYAKRWSYVTADALATVIASGYFNSKATEMTVGDIIDVMIVDAVAPASRTAFTASFKLYVASNNGSTVTTNRVDSRIVDCTAATLTISDIHDGKTITLNRAGGIAVTLPAATGSGMRLKFVVGTTFTSSGTIKVTGDDTMTGNAILAQDGGDTLVMFEAGSTADTITFDGSTTGGLKGGIVWLEDIAADLWSVHYVGAATGTEATPFSATV